MSWQIQKDESASTLRTIHFRLFTSNGTAPDTGASGDSIMLFRGISNFTCDGPVSATSAAAGMYFAVLSQSNVSVVGPMAAWHWQGDFAQHVGNVMVTNNNHYSTLSALTIPAGTYSGVTIQGVSNTSSPADVISDITTGVWYAGSRSGVTIQGLSNYANISDVTIAAGSVASVDVKKINAVTIVGAGTSGNKWRA